MDISFHFQNQAKMKKIYPPTLMLFCLLGIIALHSIVPLRAISNPLLLIFGVGLIALGMVMAYGAEGQFRRNHTTVNHLGMPARLVTDSWFRFSRNPMYLSFAVMLIGAWLALGSILPVVVILIYIVLAERWYILPEEKRLVARFGKEYESYRLRTRRWL
jgi:protein-S-isoprenylcysteine O-methyltransferase Ste14